MRYKNRDQLTWAKAKFSTVSEAKYCNRYSLERARACRSTGSAMVGEEDRQYSSATDSRTLPTKRKTWDGNIQHKGQATADARETSLTWSPFLYSWFSDNESTIFVKACAPLTFGSEPVVQSLSWHRNKINTNGYADVLQVKLLSELESLFPQLDCEPPAGKNFAWYNFC